jgi:hypothetical protein
MKRTKRGFLLCLCLSLMIRIFSLMGATGLIEVWISQTTEPTKSILHSCEGAEIGGSDSIHGRSLKMFANDS